MSTTVEAAPARPQTSPGFGWSAHELEFCGATAYSLVSAVRAALTSAVADIGAVGASERLADLLEHLENAEQALRRLMGDPDSDLPRYEALAELTSILELRGHPDHVDTLAREALASPASAPSGALSDTLHAVSYIAEWAVAGLREQLSGS